MSPLRHPVVAALIAFALLGSGHARAFNVSIDYSHDSFFSGNATAQATLEKAAADVSQAITTSLAALSLDTYTGTYGSTDVEADWDLTFSNPSGTGQITLGTFSLASNEFRVYVGRESLSGSTLAVGGPAGYSVGFGMSGYPWEMAPATDAMEVASNTSMPRGGSVSATLNGDLDWAGHQTEYELHLGYLVGSITFDSDSSTVWHYDYNSPVAGGTSDLYSVAVHEMLHTIGFGIGGPLWDSLSTGSNWTGANAISLLGTGTGILTSDSSHIASGIHGHPVINGVVQTGILQDAALTASLTLGTRKYLTDVDLAFLRDIGWTTIPEPGCVAFLALGTFAFALRRRVS